MKTVIGWLFVTLAVCCLGCGSDETHFLRCGRGISVEVDGATYCAYSEALVAELGDDFACPEGTKARVDLEGAVVCSPLAEASDPDHLPAEVCAPIRRRCGGADLEENVGLRDALCDARCDAVDRCYGGDPDRFAASCGPAIDDCKQELTGLNTIRTDWLRAQVECMETMCIGDDACTGVAADEALPGWEEDPLFTGCTQRYEACMDTGPGGNPFSDDLCALLVISIDRERTRIEACLAGPCEEVSNCVEGET